MRRYQILFLIFLNTVFLISCNQYRHMQKIQSDETCIQKFRPDFRHVVYATSVDVIGKHISGLLLIKIMPDSSTRFVFSNEMGFGFFDFGFLHDSGFRVYQIIPQMNKKDLIKTLRKDFELILFRNMNSGTSFALSDSGLVYHGFPQNKGVNYYITDTGCVHLIKMQRSSDKKPVVEAFISYEAGDHVPEEILIRHLNFNFTISLKKMNTLVAP
jgi:hypothetical protein